MPLNCVLSLTSSPRATFSPESKYHVTLFCDTYFPGFPYFACCPHFNAVRTAISDGTSPKKKRKKSFQPTHNKECNFIARLRACPQLETSCSGLHKLLQSPRLPTEFLENDRTSPFLIFFNFNRHFGKASTGTGNGRL